MRMMGEILANTFDKPDSRQYASQGRVENAFGSIARAWRGM
jgi:hypothetical protein